MSNRQESICGNVKVIQNSDYQWGVTDLEGRVIIPFGKYSWIDRYDSGLARVKNGKVSNGTISSNSKWGIINEDGIEVLPVEYDNIWNFYNKGRISTKIVKSNLESDLYFHTLNPNLPQRGFKSHDDEEEQYGRNYGEFEGSYAQDVMGYSDDVINDAFEGDPDNYWNID